MKASVAAAKQAQAAAQMAANTTELAASLALLHLKMDALLEHAGITAFLPTDEEPIPEADAAAQCEGEAPIPNATPTAEPGGNAKAEGQTSKTEPPAKGKGDAQEKPKTGGRKSNN